jgi:hypothetical protein
MFIADFSLSSPGRLSRNLWGIEWRAWHLFLSYLSSGEHIRANGVCWWLWAIAGLAYKRQAKR